MLVSAILALVLFGTTAAPALADGSQTYRVERGDTLSGIAVRYDVSLSDLVALNALADPSLVRIGQTLVIREATAPAAPPPPILAPYIRQFDGSAYADSNCGPASLAMALGALGIHAGPLTLRHLAARQMGFDNPADGTTWEALSYAARASGASAGGLVQGNRYRIWSLDDLSRQFAARRPVILLVRYRGLSDHRTSDYWGDHYIVGLGFDRAGNLIYDDPAFRTGSGADRTISRAQLLQAWGHTAAGLIRTAMALAH